MKKATLSLFLVMFISLGLFITNTAEAAVRVKSYYRPSTGAYVNSYYRSSPNRYRFDNYSSIGNYNPYTGKRGAKSYYKW